MAFWINESIERVYSAFKECHDAKFCCTAFTILVKSWQHPTAVRVMTVSASHLWEILEASRALTISTTAPIGLYELCWPVLSPLGLQKLKMSNLSEGSIMSTYWNVCAIAAQVLSMGLISYTVSHCDQIEHPYFPENFKSFALYGFGYEKSHIVTLTRLQLACIDDMLGGPVWVFGSESSPIDHTRHYLVTTAEDFVDTFGRSYFIPSESGEDMKITSIIAGGGAVIASEAKSPGCTPGARLCHWEKHNLSQGVEGISGVPFKTTDLLAIGAFETNNRCILDEVEAFEHSIGFLFELGVQPAFLRFSQVQFGLMGGRYLSGQVMGTWKRVPAINLKARVIDKWLGDKYCKLNALTSPWGLQVSLCTGAARRVPLKQLFDDTLLDFTLQLLGEEQNVIIGLIRNLFNQPTVEDYTEHIKTLSLEDRETIWHVLNATFHTLCHTGVDDGGRLRIWWPRGDTRGFAIGGLWSKMLRDSQCCAVFAAVTPHCLTLPPNVICHQDTTPYDGVRIRLFETAVSADYTSANSVLTTNAIQLQESEKYRFGSGILRISVPGQSTVFGRWHDLSTAVAIVRSRFSQRYLRERQRQADIGTTIFIQC